MEGAWVPAKIDKVSANRYIGYGRKYVPYRWRQVLHTLSGGGKPPPHIFTWRHASREARASLEIGPSEPRPLPETAHS